MHRQGGTSTSSVNGSLKAYFKWVPNPPANGQAPAPAPDHLDVLVNTVVSASASFYSNTSPNYTGGSASATAGLSQFGDSVSDSIDNSSYMWHYAPPSVVGHHLVRAQMSGSLATVSVAGHADSSANTGTFKDTNGYTYYETTRIGDASITATAQFDSRDLTISSSLGQTYHKSSSRTDATGAALPDPDIPDSGGTVHANSVVPSTRTSNMNEGTDQYDILYHANVSGGWAANSAYHWHLSLAGQPTQIQNSFPDGTFTLPNDLPLDYRGEYDSHNATAGAEEHAYIHLTDAQDGSDGTANYYVTFHAPTENWQLWHTGDPFWQEANLDHCDGDNDSTGTLAYAYHNLSVTGHFMYANEDGGVNTALSDMFAVGTGLVDPPWAGFIAAAGIAYSQIQPQDYPAPAAFNTEWDEPESTGLPMPRTHFASTDPGTLDDFKMRPMLLVHYQPQFYRGDAYGTQGYTGGATEAFSKAIGVRGAGAFEPRGTTVPPGG